MHSCMLNDTFPSIGALVVRRIFAAIPQGILAMFPLEINAQRSGVL